MASTSSIIEAMNNVTLEDEEDGVLTLNDVEKSIGNDSLSGLNPRLCLVGKFITEGVVDFSAMQQTFAALWRPGKGVCIRELDVNLFVFQFYHELDVRRVLDGSPWSFNRKAIILKRMEGNNPRCMKLDSLDLWVQIHDLPIGCMSERIIKEVGNFVGTFVESCSKNFDRDWKEYMRVRVSIDLSKPLKRRMKIRKSGDEWQWIVFKYENVPSFCFICGLLGHSEKFCGRLFDTPENEIVRPYGAWMRAPFRRQNKLIGAKWLRSGSDDGDWKEKAESGECQRSPFATDGENVGAKNMEASDIRYGKGATNFQNVAKGAILGGSKQAEFTDVSKQMTANKKGVSVVENKKRRTDSSGLGNDVEMGLNTELQMDSDGEDIMNEENNTGLGPKENAISKNLLGAGSENGARLVL